MLLRALAPILVAMLVLDAKKVVFDIVLSFMPFRCPIAGRF
jgi:hypothetical protein